MTKKQALNALAKTHKPLEWFFLQVCVPLTIMTIVAFCLTEFDKITSGFVLVFGNGSLFIFAIILLIGVYSTMRQARAFSRVIKKNIKLSTFWDCLILGGVIFLTLFYAKNVFTIYRCGIVEKMPFEQLVVSLHTWSYYGLRGAVVAIFFALAGFLATKRALH